LEIHLLFNAPSFQFGKQHLSTCEGLGMLQGQTRVPFPAFVPESGRPWLVRPVEDSANYTSAFRDAAAC